MYKLNNKEFTNATDALDQYIKNFQLTNNFKNIETHTAKSCTKEYRLDQLENFMNKNLKAPIFNNLIDKSVHSNNNSEISFIEMERKNKSSNVGSFNAINQVEKLIHNLSSKVDDFKSDGK